MSRATGATAKHGDTEGLGLDTEMYRAHLRVAGTVEIIQATHTARLASSLLLQVTN